MHGHTSDQQLSYITFLLKHEFVRYFLDLLTILQQSYHILVTLHYNDLQATFF
jgi:hypothetical protein